MNAKPDYEVLKKFNYKALENEDGCLVTDAGVEIKTGNYFIGGIQPTELVLGETYIFCFQPQKDLPPELQHQVQLTEFLLDEDGCLLLEVECAGNNEHFENGQKIVVAASDLKPAFLN